MTNAVAMVSQGLEFEALRPQLLHVHPDPDAAHAQLPGQGRPRDEGGIVIQQLAENGEFGGIHVRQSRPMSVQTL